MRRDFEKILNLTLEDVGADDKYLRYRKKVIDEDIAECINELRKLQERIRRIKLTDKAGLFHAIEDKVRDVRSDLRC